MIIKLLLILSNLELEPFHSHIRKFAWIKALD